jgi:hypothetical protein
MLFNVNIHQKTIILVLLKFILIVESCDRNNNEMHSCLHRYLERDFSVIEDLIQKSPYSPRTGQLVIDERELTDMCNNLLELRLCYESFLYKCFSFPNYSNLKRVIKTISAVYHQLCDQHRNGLKMLIEGGFCIEETRKITYCNENEFNVRHNLKWPLIVPKMLRFEVGFEACLSLTIYKKCLFNAMQYKCENISLIIWNNTMNALINEWCNSSRGLLRNQLLVLVQIVSIYFFNLKLLSF